jgi:hypothetical protein
MAPSLSGQSINLERGGGEVMTLAPAAGAATAAVALVPLVGVVVAVVELPMPVGFITVGPNTGAVPSPLLEAVSEVVAMVGESTGAVADTVPAVVAVPMVGIVLAIRGGLMLVVTVGLVVAPNVGPVTVVVGRVGETTAKELPPNVSGLVNGLMFCAAAGIATSQRKRAKRQDFRMVSTCFYR